MKKYSFQIGTEAVECSLKLARKYTGKKEIIAMMGAYHGKTFGSLSATWDKKYRDPFQPLVPEIKHVPYGNIERLEDSITPETVGRDCGADSGREWS